jgi:hypothetical protein
VTAASRYSDVQVVDRHAERQAGYDRTIRHDETPAARAPARRRARQAQPVQTQLPSTQEGKFFVRLDRGLHYRLAEPDLTFEPGKVVEVSAEVHAHLAKAVDILPVVKDREFGRVVRQKRKFTASPPYEPIPDAYPDLVEC